MKQTTSTSFTMLLHICCEYTIECSYMLNFVVRVVLNTAFTHRHVHQKNLMVLVVIWWVSVLIHRHTPPSNQLYSLETITHFSYKYSCMHITQAIQNFTTFVQVMVLWLHLAPSQEPLPKQHWAMKQCSQGKFNLWNPEWTWLAVCGNSRTYEQS